MSLSVFYVSLTFNKSHERPNQQTAYSSVPNRPLRYKNNKNICVSHCWTGRHESSLWGRTGWLFLCLSYCSFVIIQWSTRFTAENNLGKSVQLFYQHFIFHINVFLYHFKIKSLSLEQIGNTQAERLDNIQSCSVVFLWDLLPARLYPALSLNAAANKWNSVYLKKKKNLLWWTTWRTVQYV